MCNLYPKFPENDGSNSHLTEAETGGLFGCSAVQTGDVGCNTNNYQICHLSSSRGGPCQMVLFEANDTLLATLGHFWLRHNNLEVWYYGPSFNCQYI